MEKRMEEHSINLTFLSFLLPDGRVADVLPLTYGRARICVGREGEHAYQDEW